jgi:hypothetical protein
MPGGEPRQVPRTRRIELDIAAVLQRKHRATTVDAGQWAQAAIVAVGAGMADEGEHARRTAA